MKPSQGYYSVIQYCPDLSRLEAANVGVVLFCPEHGYLRARTTKGNDRVRRFFGSENKDWEQMNRLKASIERRLEIERDQFRTLADLEQFIATRANEIRLTPPRSMLVVDAERDLERLFQRLVGGRAQRASVGVVNEFLTSVFTSAGIEDQLERYVTVTLPVFHRPLTVPYGFQNGRFHLIKPVRFQGLQSSSILDRAGRYAVEGDLLFTHRDEQLGDLKLVVVGQFARDQGEVAAAVNHVLVKNETDFYTTDELGRLVEKIRSASHPTVS